MNEKIFLVVWNEVEAEQWSEALELAGWDVDTATEEPGRAYETIRRTQPQAVVIDLDRQPAYGRKVARSVRDNAHMTQVPIIFVGGTANERDLASRETSSAIFTVGSELGRILNRVVRRSG